MKTILTRLFTVMLLMMVSLGARAEVKVLFGEKGDDKVKTDGDKIEATYDGGTIVVTQKVVDATKVTVFLTVTPNKGYTMQEKNVIEAYATVPANIGTTRAPLVSEKLTLDCEDFKDEYSTRTYYVDVDPKLALWVKSADFQPQKRDGAKATGDPDYSGTYYIVSSRTDQYNANSPTTNFYLCPTENWYFYDGTNSYTETNNGKPFLTTYNCLDGNYDASKAVWIIEKSTESGCYYIKQKKTTANGKYRYLVSNGQISGAAPRRMRVHLEEVADANALQTLGDKALFEIAFHAKKELPADHLDIIPHSSSGWNGSEKRLVVNYKNLNILKASGDKTDGPNGTYGKGTGGIIGVYSTENNEMWNLELFTPKISFDNCLFTLSYPIDDTTVELRYTTDGTAPTKDSFIYDENHPIEPGIDAVQIKVTAFKKNEDLSYIKSPTATYDLTKLTAPTCELNQADGMLTLIPSVEDGIIYYKIGGDAPTITDDNKYTEPFSVTEGTIVKAFVVKQCNAPSDIITHEVVKVERPTFELLENNKVQISSETPDAIIYYNIGDNLESLAVPNTSSNLYTSPLTVETGKYFKAIAIKNGCFNSDVATTPEAIKLKCAKPSIKRIGKKLDVSCSFPSSGYTIKYTIADNGDTPSDPKSLGSTYTGAIDVSDYTPPITINAYVTAEGYTDSDNNTFTLSSWGNGTEADPFIISTQEEFDSFVSNVNTNSDNEAGKYYQLIIDVNGGSAITTPFTGSFEGIADDEDGSLPTISGLNHALFNTINGGTVKNIILDNVSISGGTNVGAICNEATGDSRIYNCGILATNSTMEEKKDGDDYDYISSCSSTISGSGYVGGIVGLLDGSSRVINCFSYANVSGGSYVGGIVGYNNVATTASNLKTMVMNCMFYGEVSGSSIAPIYNGKIITNKGEKGVSNFNYFRLESSYIQNNDITKVYNCALGAETRFLQRFEFFRHLLNSNRELAAWWATGNAANKGEMMKWVMEPSQIGTTTPYPILKENGKYPSVVNIDAENATIQTERNKGGKLGTLNVSIQMGSGGAVYGPPTGAAITTSSLTLNITDKDPDHYNFNYYKVQLPYYNEVGTGNYTGNRVVTGWKIVSVTTDGSVSSYNDFTTGEDAPAYNFADRKCINKDLYNVSGRVFNQGAYWDVPEGVTGITIQPYWAKAAYVADAYPDVVYNTAMTTAYNVPNVGGGQMYTNGNLYSIAGEDQVVYTTMGNAIASSGTALFSGVDANGHTVYDYAVVLVGNYHHYGALEASNSKPYTVTSIDLDGDNEPDYSYILRFDNRTVAHPVRVDFINIPGLGMAQKSTEGTGSYNFGIMQPKSWFETTNTSLFRVTQFEYDNSNRVAAPYIIQGGVMEQWVSGQNNGAANNIKYFHVGGNVWFKEFHRGTHQDKNLQSKHPPVSVTGGDYDEFYLTGLYTANVTSYGDNAECYINGGRFGIVAGAAMEGIGNSGGSGNTGNITWQVQNADINEFYAGGINAAKPVEGNLTSVVEGGYIKLFCGGPKFGDMNLGKTVTTTATGCTFDRFYGAGYGGNSYSRQAPRNHNNIKNFPHNDKDAGNHASWNAWLAAYYKQNYSSTYGGVSTQFSYQFLPMSGNQDNCARIFVEYVKFSLATTRNVTSNLTDCTINGNFYGGGNLGKVDGPVTSTLNGCTINGDVFGAGFSGSLPTVEVDDPSGFETEPYYYEQLGTYRVGVKKPTITYKWVHGNSISVDNTNGILYTTEDLTALGTVTGKAKLNIGVGTTVTGNVYGGGESSDVSGVDNDGTITSHVEVNIKAGTMTNVYGGGMGKNTVVAGDVVVNIGAKDSGGALSGSGSVSGNVYGGSAFGAVNALSTKDGKGNVTAYTPSNGKTTLVNMYGGSVTGSVYGGGKGDLAGLGDDHADVAAQNFGNTTVNMEGGTVSTAVYGGADTNGVLKQESTVTIIGGTVGKSTTIDNSVFGGGQGKPTQVYGNVTVNIGREKTGSETEHVGTATIHGNVYGGGALGCTNGSGYGNTFALDATKETNVNLYAGTINGNVFGGGLGQKAKEAVAADPEHGVEAQDAVEAVEAFVGGDVNVTLDGAKLSQTFTGEGENRMPLTGQIFGANNLNGTPKGHVKVHVKRTVNIDNTKNEVKNNSETALASRTTYDVTAVYGGGNQADYIPTDALLDPNVEGNPAKIEKAFAEVIIDGCAATSIEYVYGGGNAAAVPATEITVNGCYIIDQLFGGGNGKSTDTFTNPGADVGKYNGSSADYGAGVAFTKLIGGQIHVVYGGSNTKGNVREGTKMERTESNSCPLKIGEIYGAGQEAQMDGSVNIILECMPDEFVDQVFGGAKNATINGNVSLTVTSGKFGRVFGGNNLGGSINGSITVNVYEDGCEPLIIGELYGGGYNAPYSIWGCNDDNGSWVTNEPSGTPHVAEDADAIQVNVFSCTSIGKVFGGGYGSTATVVGNTHVWINTMQGIVNTVKSPTIGKIGQVFGGGNAASVKGDVSIDIGTATVNEEHTSGNETEEIGVNITRGTYTDSEHGTYLSSTQNAYIDITEPGVYGGGFSADVVGNVTLNIGTVSQKQGINIAGNIFGGGYGETTTVTGDVKVNIGADTGTASAHNYVGYANITGDVYGGSAKGKVNATKGENYASDPTDISATTGKKTQVNLYGGTITGNMYGGGLGDATHAADVYGPVTVNVEGGKVNNVFGCNNVLGSPKSTATVNIHGTPTPESPATYIIENVYGGGNMAAYTGTGGVSVAMTNGYVNNVFGGGLGSTAVVTGNTSVSVSGGTVSNNIYGGGSLADLTGDAEVTVSGGSAKIVYGGGNEASVTGNTTVNITGGILSGNKIGDAQQARAVFGGGFGQDTKVSGSVIVNIGSTTPGENPEYSGSAVIQGDVYGGSAKGMVNTSISESSPTTQVNLYKGTISNGDLYGGGLGEDNDGTENDHPANVFGAVTVSVFGGGVRNVFGCNNILGAPQSDVTVNISGGTISNNVYGGGNIAPYSGSPTVSMSGGKVLNNVYGGGLGTTAVVTGSTSVSISGGTVSKDVYGGGSEADVTGSVNVSISGGKVTHDVYGGGALASTNTANWTPGENIVYIKVTALTPTTTDESGTKPGSSVYGLYTKQGDDYIEVTNPEAQAQDGVEYFEKRVLPGDWAEGKNSDSNTTTVTLTGGTVGNVYGGGLGRQEVRTGDEVTTTAVAANVYGNITVSVNDPKEIKSPSTGVVFTYDHEDVTIGENENAKTYFSVPLTGRVFGCNNLNGSPLGNVTVHVYSTRQRDGAVGQHSPNSTNPDYEIQAVYGGGNQANYLPAVNKKTKVTVWGCGETSIMRVYGGGNSASVPATDVEIWGSYDIGYAFGGGNGGQPIQKNGAWVANEGANVNGQAKITCYGGKIGSVFGGSDSKGVCRSTSLTVDQPQGSCPLVITKFFAGGNEGIVDGDVNMVIAACTDNSEIEYVCGGSYKAHIKGSVHLTITGGFFKSVYGGNDHEGSIGGNIVIDIEETDPCDKPIIIENLVGGGNEADFPGRDENNQPISVDPEHPRKITVNVKSATRIDNVYGGCFMAEAKANTEVNINMVQGNKVNDRHFLPDDYGNKAAEDLPANITDVRTDYVAEIPANGISVIGYYVDNNGTTPATGVANGTTTYYKKQVTGFIKNEIGTIGNVFGGGRQGKVSGNATVNIGTSTTVPIMSRDNSGNILATDEQSIYGTDNKIRSGITIAYTNQDVLGAHIDGDVFGGGNEAVVTGNTFVNICTENYSNTTGFEGISIDKNNANGGGGSVYGGGRLADVLGNTNVTMKGGYVYNGIFGGGYSGSVGTFTRDKTKKTDEGTELEFDHSTHSATCLGKPTSCTTGTGKCTVVVNGGQIGPVEVATKGMPNPHGWVWGGGCGLVEDPADNPDMHFAAYVNETDVTIGGTAFIMEGVIGGGEFGRVLHNTLVKIEGGQIGVGAGQTETVGNVTKPKRYDEAQFINPAETGVTTGNALAACSHYDYGNVVDGKKEFKIYDPYADKYPTLYPGGSTNAASNGGTWIGIVCGGGSGYMPYEKKDGSGYDWCRSAGLVEGNSEVRISGGHILTNVYGANEYTDVLGNSKVTMSGGTIGVPRTLEQIAENPLVGYLFGAGKGDARSHFDSFTNVEGNTIVEVSGGIIYGSVLGGAEDGHVLGNTSVTISGGIIGTWGTSYVDGNVFGGGRGFSGENLVAGSVSGDVAVSITGGTILGSVYGGGRLASVGIDPSVPVTLDSYGQLVDDGGDKTYGHITITISGGTIGGGRAGSESDLELKYYDMRHSGNVFGGSMGRLELLDGTRNPLWPKLAVVKQTDIKISGTADIKNSVYGGSEYGIVRDLAVVNMAGGTVYGNIFGGGYGSDDATPSLITAGDYETGTHYVFTPMIWTGCVSGDTEVNVSGGTVKKNVYGGGEMASVGLINCNVVEDNNGDITIGTKKYRYTNITKHNDIQGTGTDEKAYGFALSWPYEFKFIPSDPKSNHIGGKATVNVTGGHIGSTTWDDRTGYVFGGSKGQVAFKKKVGNELVDITDIHEQRYTEAFSANVRETEVNINYGSTPTGKTTSNIGAEDNCIMGAVYGGGEDGHVMENAAITFENGLTGLSIYGGGKGEGTYTGTRYVYNESTKTWTLTDNVPDLPSWTAGKVYGNTSITMTGGHVMGNVYGGGNLGSVGKGNYAGGTDDYYPAGYGETLNKDGASDKDKKLWDSSANAYSAAFLNSGKCTINITGGKVGTLNGLYGNVGGTSNATPTGMVFGGSRGRAARDVGALSPRYYYAPEFFLGYVNNTEVTIGTRNAETGPTIYSQVFGGGRDGHVRGSAKVEINAGTIGQTYDESGTYSDASLIDYQRYHRGNVYGSGSGLGTWDNGTHHGTSSGSVTRNTTVDIYGGTIYNNVYGGGAMATVGPPKIGASEFAPEDWSKCTVNIYGGTIGDPTVYDTYKYGGTIYGASRGDRGGDLADGESIEDYATVLWTEVNIKPHPTDRNKDVVIAGNVYGGARGGEVKKDTKVNLTGGVIKHNAYGGGRGMATIAANVGGNTTVELNNNNNGGDADGSKKGCVVERIFGCNDQNGTPKGNALVHVYATQNKNKDLISEKIAPPPYNSSKGSSETYAGYLKRLIDVAKPSGSVLTGIDAAVITHAEGIYNDYKNIDDASLTDAQKKEITDEANKVIKQLESLHDYDVQAVYGGGDLALYEPATAKTEVIIEGCSTTSIKQVYGGGNAAPVPATDVLVKSCLIIDELFGGGNGKDNYLYSDGKWYENPGANVGYTNYTEVVKDQEIGGITYDGTEDAKAYRAVEVATTPQAREAYKYGSGIATTNVNGGHIHAVYGGSNMKGNISNGINLQLLQSGTCTLITDEAYASSKSATTDAESSFVLDCVKNGGTIYGGSYNADLYSDVNILIKNGHYDKIFGGNNQAGTVNGSITITIAEAGCTPITIDELYGGGYLAPYSIYGYKTEKRNAKDADGNDLYDESHNLVQQRIPYKPGEAGALTTPYWNPRINIVSATRIDKIFGGGYGAGATMVGSPLINVNMEKGMILKDKKDEYPDSYTSTTVDAAGNIILPIGTIGDIYGGGNLADVIGNTNVEIGTGRWISSWDENGNAVWETTNMSGDVYTYKLETPAVYYTQEECDEYNAKLTGAVSAGDVQTPATYYVEGDELPDGKQVGDEKTPAVYYTTETANAYNATLIGAKNTNDAKVPAVWGWYNASGVEIEEAPSTTGRNAAKITGNVFGGGKGKTLESGEGAFKCESAMIGADGDGLIDANGGTSVTISNGSVDGSVYGGGEIGRVEKNTVVTIGIPGNTTNEITIAGNVFGAGKGVATHGYAALVRGNSTVTIQGRAKVGGSVYGGGEIASVGRYNIDANGLPQSLTNEKSGNCTVIIRDDAEIGPDNMTMTKAGGPDNAGHVFGAGKGATPYVDKDGNSWSEPWRVKPDNSKDTYSEANETQYLKFIETLGLATQTNVTISGNAFVKGDVFGGAEQGFVQHDTHVTIEGDCQIGNGYVQMDDDGNYLATSNQYSINRRYTTTEWTEGRLYKDGETNYQHSLPECASWPYLSPYASHDIYAASYDSKGGAVSATSGHTFYGNVFGGGSGYFPYAAGKWHWKAGNVGGNTLVEIKGGHILTNVYGGNEMTNVEGKCTVNMSGGTIGVPRTMGQILNHPVTCYLFGGGGGDPRVLFNKQTNVQDVEMNITGGWVYGSVFGGGEDGHVMRNVDITIGGTAKIGTWGTSYVDGNVFGGGRGFSGDAYTAGNVAGSVTMNINGGEILGSVYGGGRLGSVGYGLYDEGVDGYGEIRDDHKFDNGTDDDGFFTKGRGHVNITISGGTIGNDYEYIIPKTGEGGNTPGTITETDFTKWSAADWITWKNHNHVPNTEYDPSNGRLTHTKGGNVYGGGMGRYYQLDGTTPISAVDWWKVGNVKSTTLNISGDTWIMGNVYGGGELGAVVPYTDNTDADNPVVEGGTTSISITGGTIGTEVTGTTPVKETVPVPDEGNSSVQYTYGSVYGGGMGMEKHDNNDRHGGDVKGSTTVSMSGSSTKVRASVFGGGEIAVVDGNTNVTISGGEIGRNEVKAESDADPGYVLFGGATMGNVYGGGKGVLEHILTGLVKGNTNVTINAGETTGQPFIYHNVYGGGALGSVGTFTASTGTGDDAHVPAGVPLHWTSGGTATVTINGGTIGISGRDNGMVNGSSRGGIEKPSGTPAIDRYDKVAWVKDAVVTIGEASGSSAGPHIKGSVYGGGENGHNSGNATVTVNRGTIGIVNTTDQWYSFIPSGLSKTDDNYATYEAIDKKALVTRGNVYGAGCGTDMYDSDNDGIDDTHNPKSGMVAGNTFVNIAGGHIGHSVYGAGSMGAVGTITSEVEHASVDDGFGLSWPYEFVFAPNTGKATVNITGGHIGNNQQDGGDVFGSARGEAGDRYATAHLAFVKETEVNVDYVTPATEAQIPTMESDISVPCVTGSVHGSGEDGYVYGDAKVTINKGLIGHSVYGAGKGKGTYKVTLDKIVGDGNYDANIYSLISGKVMGNTYVTMNGGLVGRNVYGGGNMASVGKGNYAGGTDDYYPAGYGEKLTGKLWDNSSEDSKAFLGSGKTTVNVIGGQVGIVTTVTKNNLPYGNVFGGSAGEAAPNVPESLRPREKYCPAFFSGYVNETDVTIGGYRCTTECTIGETTYKVGDCITAAEYNALTSNKDRWEQVGPTIVASVYGGGQDGHVRRDTKVTVNSGVIGLAYNSDNQGTLGTSNLDDPQWLHRGNIYGAGSGISEYEFDFDNSGTISGSVTIGGKAYPEKGYSTSAGSVTRFTEVNVLGGTIHRNVYGGGSMGGVGAPKITQEDDQYKKGDSAEGHGEGKQSQCTVNIGGGTGVVTIGTPIDYQAHYGGEVYGASRGLSAESPLGSVVWTKVLVKDGAYIQGNVFGGGDAGMVKKDTEVQIGEPVTTTP